MHINREEYKELIRLLKEDISPSDAYHLLDECLYELVLVADHLESVENLGGRYIALRQLRDAFGKLSKGA